MLDKPNETHAFVTELNEHGTGFAVRIDNGEQVFIRSVLSDKSGIEVGDRIAVWYVPNRIEEHAERCPWFALHVKVAEEGDQVDVKDYIEAKTIEDAFMRGSLEPEPEPKPQPQRNLYDEAYAFLDMNGPATTSQVAAALGVVTQNIRTYLANMNDRGEICRADIRSRGAQIKAGATVWAVEFCQLIPEEVEL